MKLWEWLKSWCNELERMIERRRALATIARVIKYADGSFEIIDKDGWHWFLPSKSNDK